MLVYVSLLLLPRREEGLITVELTYQISLVGADLQSVTRLIAFDHQAYKVLDQSLKS